MCEITKENDSLQRQTENKDEDSQKIQGNKNIPELRFPEFEGEWNKNTLNNLAKIQRGASPRPISSNRWYDNENKKVGWVRIGDVTNSSRYLYRTEDYFSEEGIKKSRFLPKGSLIMSICATIGKPIITEIDTCIHDGFVGFSDLTNINKEFLYYILKNLENKFISLSQTGSQANLNTNLINKTKINMPSIKEQEKIANFLTCIDQKIELMEKIVENFLSYHKYIIQHLPLDPHNLIKKEGWQLLYLNEILFEHKLKSNGFEEVFSVSVEKGLINQIEHLGRSFSAKNTDKYNLVKYGDIVYTKSPTGDFPLGIIKQSHVKNNVIVSPLYVIFTQKTFELGYILENYFKYPVNCHNYLHSIVQKGAKNTMNITNKTFLSKQLYLPTNINEQKRIFNILYSLNRKIDLISDEIKEMREFKKGLLQKMFC